MTKSLKRQHKLAMEPYFVDAGGEILSHSAIALRFPTIAFQKQGYDQHLIRWFSTA